MKLYLILIFALGTGSARAESLAHGMGFSVHYSLANEFATKVGGTTTNYTTTRALGLGFKLSDVSSDSIGWSAGLSYEWPRGISPTMGAGSEPNLSMLLFESNGTLGMPQNFFLEAGLNYSVPITSGLGSGIELNNGFGVQLGGGYVPAPNFNIELLYRTVNFEGKSGGTQFDYARLWGFLLRLTLYIP